MNPFQQDGNRLIYQCNQEIIQIEPWGENSLRVRATHNRTIRDDLPGALLPQQETGALITITERRGSIQNGALHGEIHLEGDLDGQRAEIHFINTLSNEEILAEPSSHFPRYPARYFRAAGGDYLKIEQRFRAYEGERLYGLGQHQHGRLDQKGVVIDLAQVNTEVCIPFLLSNRGYGFLWHNPGIGRVELGLTETRWVAEAAPQLDYWITVGETPAEIMENYAAAVGSAPILPEWAAGFWQCKLRYRTQEELLEVAREYRRRDLPLSVIVIDFFHWSKQGDWQFDPACWPDPKAMVQELEEMGVKVMVSIWPTVNVVSKNFPEMQRRNLLVRTERGVPATMNLVDTGQEGIMYGHFYDPTHPEARRFIWEQVREGYYRHGIKVFWLDACEPEIKPRDFDNLRYYLGNGLAVTNLYPYFNAQAFYEGMRAEGETEIINLSRSAWAGSQRFGAALWSGDIQSTFEALRAQVPAGLNAGLSGIPWWTTDIGGFFNGDVRSPYFRELIVRWFQYGLFCPLFRLHGFRQPYPAVADGIFAGGPNEAWSFGEEAYGIIRELLFTRERLKPYTLAQMALAHERGIPPMRPLFFDFPQDAQSWGIDDQFMFGPDLLVAPVLHEGARSRSVYLPPSTAWRDAWTGEISTGGQTVEAAAPLERIPLYLRGEAWLPIRKGNP
jgi:alpha-D-xyloside xylohydrolase